MSLVPKRPAIITASRGSSFVGGSLAKSIGSGLLDAPTVKNEVTNLENADDIEGSVGQDFKILKGNKLKLLCKVEGEPIPQIKWLKDDVETVQDINAIIIDTNQADSSGSYVCIATNVFGSVKEASQVDIVSKCNCIIFKCFDRLTLMCILCKWSLIL